jgi:hypothetical protein
VCCIAPKFNPPHLFSRFSLKLKSTWNFRFYPHVERNGFCSIICCSRCHLINSLLLPFMGVWHGVANWPWTGHALPSYFLWAGHFWNSFMAITGVASLQCSRPAAVFYPFGHPMPTSMIPFPIIFVFMHFTLKFRNATVTASPEKWWHRCKWLSTGWPGGGHPLGGPQAGLGVATLWSIRRPYKV